MEVGFFDVINIEAEKVERKILTVVKMLTTYSVKILLGISSMNMITDKLFKDIALLQIIGFTATEIQNGICNRGSGKSKPMHKDTLADWMEKLTEPEVEYILNEAVKKLRKKKLLEEMSGNFVIDASDLETTKKYEGCGSKTVTEKHVDKNDNVYDIEVTKYGFKLIIIYEVSTRIVVAAKVVKINEKENIFLMELVEQAIKNIGKNKIKIMLLDRGFIDGLRLWKLKDEYKIDFVIPGKTDMNITTDARGMRKLIGSPSIYYGETKYKNGEINLKVIGVEKLTGYSQYGSEKHNAKNSNKKDFKGNPLNAVVVLQWEDKKYLPGKEKVFLTTLPVKRPEIIIDDYGLRSLVENCAFRELKQGWNINKFPKKTERAVRSHVLLTLVIFNMCNLYRTKQGEKLTEQGIRRFRRSNYDYKIVIFTEEHFAIFDIEEFALLTGANPEYFFRIDPKKFKKEYGLK